MSDLRSTKSGDYLPFVKQIIGGFVPTIEDFYIDQIFHHFEFERLNQSGSLPVLYWIAIKLALVFQHRASDAKQSITDHAQRSDMTVPACLLI